MRAVVGLLGAVLLLAGCSTSVDRATDESSRDATTSAAAQTPPPAAPGTADPVEAARAALLPPGELGEIIGDTDVQQTATFTQPGQASAGIEPRDCAARLLFQEAVGADGYQAVIGDNNRGARGQSAAQLIQVFPETSPVWPQPGRQALRVAGNTVRMINDEQCREGVVFTTTAKDVTQHWTAGPVTAENPEALPDPRRDTARGGGGVQRVEAPARNCYHAVLARGRTVVESIVCGDGDSQAQANQVIDRIAAKLPAPK
ncbi:sensor domain-containing protein [Mycolicibacterium nivoides]|uniref:Sensor domain-containing protein n=1 Tax=Mycolicibacterium nivoides TaxID=2487344 RepID=A0ABW9LDH6_9MYCO